MKSIVKKSIILIVVLFMVLMSLIPIFAVSESDFEANPRKYQEMCSGVISEENYDTCVAYKSYLINKAQSDQSDLDSLDADRDKIQSNIIESLSLIEKYNAAIAANEASIAALENEIAIQETEIVRLEGEIKVRVAKVEEAEKEVKEYMVNSQSTMRVNGYIEFVMGANDFSDIIRRIEGMNHIKRYNQALIDTLQKERDSLDQAKASVEAQKVSIELDKDIIETEKQKNVAIKANQSLIHEELVRQKISFDTAAAEIQEKIQISEDLANQIDTIQPSGSMQNPVPGARKTESVWHYSDWGGVHLGTDLAAGVNTPILAMGNGIVVVAQGGCATTGSFGCNGGMGNHLTMIFEADGHIYGALIMHIAAGSFRVSAGTIVSKGEQVAGVGDSGSSYGAHAHVELFDLGVSTVQEGLDMWNSTWRTAQFGLGGSAGGLSSICENRGTPCRLNPEGYLGV